MQVERFGTPAGNHKSSPEKRPLSRRDWLRLGAVSLGAGSVSGWLGDLAAQAAQDALHDHEDDGERRMQELSKYLEPAIIIAMGVIVALVVVSILLPMLSMSKMSA